MVVVVVAENQGDDIDFSPPHHLVLAARYPPPHFLWEMSGLLLIVRGNVGFGGPPSPDLRIHIFPTFSLDALLVLCVCPFGGGVLRSPSGEYDLQSSLTHAI